LATDRLKPGSDACRMSHIVPLGLLLLPFPQVVNAEVAILAYTIIMRRDEYAQFSDPIKLMYFQNCREQIIVSFKLLHKPLRQYSTILSIHNMYTYLCDPRSHF
jgi:hypothetical protein